MHGFPCKSCTFGHKSCTKKAASSICALPWGNYDRKVNSWPLRPPLRSYQWYRNQRACSPEIIFQSGIPNGEIIAATQSSSICYAPATQSILWMLWESILPYKILLGLHRPYDKKWTYGRYSLTVETTSSSFDTRWGGRGRKFKSCHSDQKSGIVRFPIFLYLSRKISWNLAFSWYT